MNVNSDDDFYEEEKLRDHNDNCKIFLSRIPPTFGTDTVKCAMETTFGKGCVVDVSLVENKVEDGTSYSGRRKFGFVVLSTEDVYQKALDIGIVQGKLTEDNKRKYTMYIQPVVRDDRQELVTNKNICFRWKSKTCPYGDKCQFLHEGEGGCITKTEKSKQEKKIKKKTKRKSPNVCIHWRTKGKCRKFKINKCPYTHDDSVLQEFIAKKKNQVSN